jgi:hypothetical protein
MEVFLLLFMSPTMVSACSSLCVTKCLKSFDSPTCPHLCGCSESFDVTNIIVSLETAQLIAECGAECQCSKALDYYEYMLCCIDCESVRNTTTLLSNGDHSSSLAPELQKIQECQESCNSFCIVLSNRQNPDCSSLCSALFCADPAQVEPQITLASPSPEQNDTGSSHTWVFIVLLTIIALLFIVVVLLSSEGKSEARRLPSVLENTSIDNTGLLRTES